MIERLSARIAEPASYLQGRVAGRPILPMNIICFVRRRADVLGMRLRPKDQHHRFVLIVALRGSGQVCVDAGSYSLQPGQAQLIFPFQFHSYLLVRPAKICWVYLTFEMEKVEEIESLRSSPSRDLGPAELELLAQVVRDWTSSRPQPLLQHQLAMLLGRLSARKVGAKSRQTLRIENLGDNILFQVNRHAMTRLDRPMGLKGLASTLGQSESHLRRRFRLATGFSLGHYLKELRLQRACRLLRDTALTVGEVAGQCGFDSIYSFSRAFKNGLNLSPRAYRQSSK